MPIELEQVVLLEQEIVVLVDLPKAAIDHIEMLVGEIVPNLVHVLGPVEVAPRADKVRLATLELLQRDLTSLRAVETKEETAEHRIAVPLLKLGGILQELEPGMLEKRLDAVSQISSLQIASRGQELEEVRPPVASAEAAPEIERSRRRDNV
jgi:hypothetical protein